MRGDSAPGAVASPYFLAPRRCFLTFALTAGLYCGVFSPGAASLGSRTHQHAAFAGVPPLVPAAVRLRIARPLAGRCALGTRLQALALPPARERRFTHARRQALGDSSRCRPGPGCTRVGPSRSGSPRARSLLCVPAAQFHRHRAWRPHDARTRFFADCAPPALASAPFALRLSVITLA